MSNAVDLPSAEKACVACASPLAAAGVAYDGMMMTQSGRERIGLHAVPPPVRRG